jgi:4-hydroxybenzoate polyprenyltransferase
MAIPTPTPRLRDYLELVRVPNLFTSMGDVVAGYLVLTRGVAVEWRDPLLLLAASVCLYAGGVVLNDYFDADVDRLERPERPIPSGRVAPGRALRFGAGLLGLGCIFAAAVGLTSLLVAAVLVGCIVLYDARGKRIPYVGSLNMGACRFLNVLLGASGAGASRLELWLWFVLPVAGIVMGYIAAVTVLSTGEVWGGNRAVAGSVLAALVAVVAAVLWLGLTDRLSDGAYLPFLALFAGATLPVAGRVVLAPSAANIRRAIKVCILSLLLLDAAFAAGAAGFGYGLLVALLIVPSLLTARLFAVT